MHLLAHNLTCLVLVIFLYIFQFGHDVQVTAPLKLSLLCVAGYISAVCCSNRLSGASSQPQVGVYVCPSPIVGLGSFLCYLLSPSGFLLSLVLRLSLLFCCALEISL